MSARHNVSLAAVAITLTLLGIASRVSEFLYLAIPPLALLGVAILFRPPTMTLHLERSVTPDRGVVGEQLTIRIVLRSGSRGLPLVEILDRLPRGAELVEGSNHHLLAIPGGSSVTIEYRVVVHTPGSYAFGPLVARSRDPLGIRVEEQVMPASASITVAPSIERVRRFGIRPRRTKVWLGQIMARRRGFGTEFWGIREYQPGDDVHNVNWKASARHSKLLTNEKESEQSGDAVIVLDARRHPSVGRLAEDLRYHGIRAAMSIAAKLIEGRNRVGVIVQRDVVDWVALGSGRRHLLHIANVLSAARPGGRWSLSSTRWFLRHLFPTQCHVILITPLLDRSEFDVIESLLADGFEVSVLSPSPIALEASLGDPNSQADLARRLLTLERGNYLSRLRRKALVIDWNPRIPLAAVLQEVRTYPVRH
jgi:uncharacterized protein (DUF58 family)